jgi:hypothetical protein
MLLTDFTLAKMLAYGIYFEALSSQRQFNTALPIALLFSRPSTTPLVFLHFEVRRERLAAFRTFGLIGHGLFLADVAMPLRWWVTQNVINNRKIAVFDAQ